MTETAPDRASLTTRKVVFLVIAAAAPIAAMVGNVPLALARSHSIDLPAAFVIAAVVLICFAVGYAAMSQRIVNSGAFYTFVARSLGRHAGISTAYIALAGYGALAMGLAASFGYFTRVVLLTEGVGIPWWVYTAGAIVVVAFLGFRNADVSAKLLSVLMVGEFLVLIVLDLGIVGHKGTAAFPSGSFAPHNVFTGSLGISLMFAFTSFVGFESAALYGEETKDPERSIPRALYASVGLIAVFYVVTSWIIIGGAGGAAAPAAADRSKNLGDLVVNLAQQFGGTGLYDATAVLLCTSLLASYVAVHNAASRYLFALGREGVAPKRLGNYHPRHLSPHVGSVAMTGATVVVLGILAIVKAAPYTLILPALVGLGTFGVIVVQAATAIAVLVFFWGRSDRSLIRTIICPLLAAGGLAAAFGLAVVHYGNLVDSSNIGVELVPLILVVAGVAGVLVTERLRRRRPAAYAALARSTLRRRTATKTRETVATYEKKYCLVGAGPSGMIMARALLKQGVPFDWYERNPDFGGIWDIDHDGSPMYESAHFISSKYTSGFFGAPMPSDLPDYPSWRQIRDYIRGFGRQFDLYDHVQFDTSVEGAELLDGDRWKVTTSTGSVTEYDGLICAPGVTWHPNIPTLPGEESFTGEVRHAVSVRDGLEFRGKRVLIVGGGNSAVDIASDAARHADQAWLSVRRGYRFIPKHIGGLPTDAVLGGILPPPKGMALAGDPNELIDALVGDLTRWGLPAPDHDALTSHPIMNSQVLHHLAHGDLIAKPDVDHVDGELVHFKDGTSERIDVVILATGYQYLLPFLDSDLLTWKSGHPQLYLNVFSRQVPSLYVLGFIEFADAAYKRFDEMAQLIMIDIAARETGDRYEEIQALKRDDHPDLRGGIDFIDSPRHANYVESATYQGYLASFRERFDWPDVDDYTYADVQHPADVPVQQLEAARV